VDIYLFKPKFHLARHVSTRLDTFDFVKRVERVDTSVSIASSCACSNMADDEQAIVLACTSLVVFMPVHTQILFVPSNEINQINV